MYKIKTKLMVYCVAYFLPVRMPETSVCMAPTAVLIKPTNTITIMNSSVPNILTIIDVSLSNGINSDLVFFAVYKHSLVESGDVSIKTFVPAAISAIPYRKTLITKLLFRQIITLNDTSSVSFSDVMSTIASYFSFNTGPLSGKWEADSEN